ncbi:PEP-CTERM sorting domain-containing protein [bacterium]|nr:PEP-CTERM sorting domain-containing protein [bacterium]
MGKTFDFLYQANLTGFTNPLGNPITAPTGFNTAFNTGGFELTFVAKIPEIQINAISPTFPQTASFATNGPGQWAIYYDSATQGGNKSSVPLGTGFNDGTLIANGHFVVGEVTSGFLSTSLVPPQGVGGFIIHGLVDSYDPTFISLDEATGLPIFDLRLEGTINIPALDSTTVSFFDGNDGFAVTPADAVDDLLFKVDSSSKFSVQVPEPSSFILMGLGLLGAAGFVRRRKNP